MRRVVVSWLRKGACTEKVARTDPGFNVVVVVVEGGGWVTDACGGATGRVGVAVATDADHR
ncbi:MAG: hypothetical protein M3137_14960 [Actinomycetota bacterium]|nr:hypothetical protein [Actinomycetota bacterium]